MSNESLNDLLRSAGDPVELLRNNQVGRYVYPTKPPEFSNWIDEQRAWTEDCILYDQTWHMDNMYVKGPDAERLLRDHGINSFKNFTVGKAKQYVPVSPDGFVIGDGILFHLEEDLYEFVGRSPAPNWVHYNAEAGDYDVEITRDPRAPSITLGKPVNRTQYRFQIQGPKAEQLIKKLTGGDLPNIKFFNFDSVTMAGRRLPALRHGMAGQPGLEVWGPYEEYDEVRDAILEAGEEFGIRPVGARAYSTNTIESGWIPSPLPAIYTGEKMSGYRDWVPANSLEGRGGTLAGSFVSDDIEDYYLTPYEMGYGHMAKLDHDFVGRDALEAMDKESQRRKVTLAWNAEDVLKVWASLLSDEVPYKYLDLPQSVYGSASYDRVVHDGKDIGLSLFTGYTYNERRFLSLAVVDPSLEVGSEVKVVWGEPDGGSRKLSTERPHRQIEIRATVSPVPYSREAREHYAEGWRTAGRA
ncbi:vanillate/3-O-methylgallate O-demethylase [Egicoccus halophilus]|uniref:Glycine cleavage system protein T n=1 Tax=Egicoccus halophilus TaxID=1670830 RepID=A0A8J3A5Z8_9ACTN|nr:aminomethyltransferase family protein [Egicoccus halophilus]GGI04114.1 glycine cleavage system protein T [Egicoccus halophilus]